MSIENNTKLYRCEFCKKDEECFYIYRPSVQCINENRFLSREDVVMLTILGVDKKNWWPGILLLRKDLK